jgi:hypothetical protein
VQTDRELNTGVKTFLEYLSENWRPTEDDIDRFGYGRCMYLAHALHSRLKGHIEGSWDKKNGYMSHVWAVDKHGNAWDVHGKRPASRARDEHTFRRADGATSPDYELMKFSHPKEMWKHLGALPNRSDLRDAHRLAQQLHDHYHGGNQ